MSIVIHQRQNYDSSFHDSDFDDSTFDINLYQYDVDCKDINESFEYSCDPMFYHILNDLEFYEQDLKCVINEKYLSKTYNESEISNMYIQK